MFKELCKGFFLSIKKIFPPHPTFSVTSMLTGAWSFVVDEVVALFFCYLHLKAK